MTTVDPGPIGDMLEGDAAGGGRAISAAYAPWWPSCC